MTKIVELVKPAPNSRLIDGLKDMLAQPESGEIDGIAGIKLRPDNGFAFYRIGDCSDLELAGALAFAQHDLIAGNPKRE